MFIKTSESCVQSGKHTVNMNTKGQDKIIVGRMFNLPKMKFTHCCNLLEEIKTKYRLCVNIFLESM